MSNNKLDLHSRVRVKNRTTLHQGFISLERADIERDGTTKRKTALIARDAVHVVALLDDEQVLLVRQYRYPISKNLLEIPAGGIDKGESPQQAANRELLEETGYQAADIKHLGSFFSAPGSSSEVSHFYLATGLHFDEDSHRLAEEADLVIEKVPFLEALDCFLHNSEETVDGKSALGLLLAAKHLGVSQERSNSSVMASSEATAVKVISEEVIIEDGGTTLTKAEVEIAGEKRERLAFNPRDIIHALPVSVGGESAFIYHYRWPISETLAEVVAGGIDEGESASQAARREIAEEVSLVAGELQELGRFYYSPGTMTSWAALFLAEGCHKNQNSGEGSLEVAEAPLNELIECFEAQSTIGCLLSRLTIELALLKYQVSA